MAVAADFGAGAANGSCKEAGRADVSFDQRQLGQLTAEEAGHVRALSRRLQQPRQTGGEELPAEVDAEGLYNDLGSLVRYLRARQWDVHRAETMIRNTAAWRKRFNLRALQQGSFASVMAHENATGKLYVRGFDRLGRPVMYMKPRFEQSFDPDGMVKHLVYNMERAMACIERQEKEKGPAAFNLADVHARKLVMLVDFQGCGWHNMVPLATAREVVTIMQDHYPERLGQALLINVHWVLSGFFNSLKPYFDPVTVEKFQFVSEEGEALAERMSRYCDLSVLECDFGGSAVEPFDSHTYLQVGGYGPGTDSEFGFEFNEQSYIASPRASVRRPSQAAPKVSKRAPVWSTYSDPRVLALPRDQRSAVRDLAQKLAEEPDRNDEAAAGLFDDAGALIRHLRDARWDGSQAFRQLRATARWRSSFGVDALRMGAPADVLARENADGRLFVRGFDCSCRPVLVVRLRRRDLRCSEDYVRHAVYCIERAAACLDARQNIINQGSSSRGGLGRADDQEAEARRADGKFTLLVDFTGYAARHRPRLRTVWKVMWILLERYPERLGHVVLLGPPSKVFAWWRLISWSLPKPLLDRVVVVSGPPEEFPSRLKSLLDAAVLERCLMDGPGADAFVSDVFLHVPTVEGIFGAEFDAQLAASRVQVRRSSASPAREAIPGLEGRPGGHNGGAPGVGRSDSRLVTLESVFGADTANPLY